MRLLLSLILVATFALPVMAEQTLTPIEVEAIPFDNSSTINTQPIGNTIDMRDEVGPLADTDGKKAGLPQFDVTTFSSQLFWLAITFVVLYFYFAKGALPKLSLAIENRRATIRKDLEQADALSNDIDKTRADYEAAMQDAHNKARDTLTSMQDNLRKDADEKSNAFKAKTDKAIADFEAKAENAKAAIKADLNDVAVALTHDIINKITDLDVKDTDIANAVQAYSGSDASPSKTKKAA